MKYTYKIIDNNGIIVAEDDDKQILNLFVSWLKNYQPDKIFKIYPFKV